MNSEIKNVEKRLQKAIESNDPILRFVYSLDALQQRHL
jgi:hypothetical protein